VRDPADQVSEAERGPQCFIWPSTSNDFGHPYLGLVAQGTPPEPEKATVVKVEVKTPTRRTSPTPAPSTRLGPIMAHFKFQDGRKGVVRKHPQTGESIYETEGGDMYVAGRTPFGEFFLHPYWPSPPQRSSFGTEIDRSPGRAVTPDRARTPHSMSPSVPSRGAPRTPERRVSIRMTIGDSPSDRRVSFGTPVQSWGEMACPGAPARAGRPTGAAMPMHGPAMSLSFSPVKRPP